MLPWTRPAQCRPDLRDGTTFSASDCVRLVPPDAPPGMVAVHSSAARAWIDAGPLDLQLDRGRFAAHRFRGSLSPLVRRHPEAILWAPEANLFLPIPGVAERRGDARLAG